MHVCTLIRTLCIPRVHTVYTHCMGRGREHLYTHLLRMYVRTLHWTVCNKYCTHLTILINLMRMYVLYSTYTIINFLVHMFGTYTLYNVYGIALNFTEPTFLQSSLLRDFTDFTPNQISIELVDSQCNITVIIVVEV